jgi:hypothetical protein
MCEDARTHNQCPNTASHPAAINRVPQPNGRLGARVHPGPGRSIFLEQSTVIQFWNQCLVAMDTDGSIRLKDMLLVPVQFTLIKIIVIIFIIIVNIFVYIL